MFEVSAPFNDNSVSDDDVMVSGDVGDDIVTVSGGSGSRRRAGISCFVKCFFRCRLLEMEGDAC